MNKARVLISICIVGLMLASFSGCANSTATHDDWLGQDKALHFGYSAFIGVGGSAIAYQHYRTSEASAYAIGMVSALGLGALKEWYDLRMKDTYWSWKDFFWDILGGTAGSALGTHVR